MLPEGKSRSTILGLITARGGSKGIPDKNIRNLVGKPLIAWTIEAALSSLCLDRVIVSTEDDRIADLALQYGAKVPFMRPAELAQDRSSSVDVAIHALKWLSEFEGYSPDYVMLLQPTSPLRTSKDIQQAVSIVSEDPTASVVSVTQAHPHPYWMKTVLPNGSLSDIFPAEKVPTRRQDLPPAYAFNGAIYIVKPEVLLTQKTFIPENTLAYIMPPENSLDIDTPWEFYLAELILKDRLRYEND